MGTENSGDFLSTAVKVNYKSEFSNNFIMTEAIKTLRSNLLFCGKSIKTVLVTSAMESEGKTTVSTELAKSLSEIDKKVLLIYADMRKPKTIKNRRVAGLSELLSDQVMEDDVICSTQLPGFDLIFSGELPPNPVELLNSETFKRVIASFEKKYDYIIIDTPPLVPVIDAAVISSVCDGAIFVIAADKSSYYDIKKAMEQLEKTDCKILGAVLNDTKRKVKSTYRKKYYYYKDGKRKK